MNASVEELENLGVKTGVIARAYIEKINQAVRLYYELGGIRVLGIAGLEITKPVEQVKLPDYASYKLSSPCRAYADRSARLLIAESGLNGQGSKTKRASLPGRMPVCTPERLRFVNNFSRPPANKAHAASSVESFSYTRVC
jgi:hypothetical protein